MKAAQVVVFSWKACAYSHFVSSMHPGGAELVIENKLTTHTVKRCLKKPNCRLMA